MRVRRIDGDGELVWDTPRSRVHIGGPEDCLRKRTSVGASRPNARSAKIARVARCGAGG